MPSFRTLVLGSFVALGLAVAAPPPAQAAEPDEVRANAVLAFAGIGQALEAQSDFAVARSRADRGEMRDAAADMLVGLARATFWLAVLDRDVDASGYSEEIDAEVADLLALSRRALDRVDDYLYADDMEGLGSALDESADLLNGLSQSVRRVLDTLFPVRR